MAVSEFSFDIVSRADAMEIKNALNQADKDLGNRYDLKGTKCEIVTEKDETKLIADDEFRMDQLKEIVFSKLLKRGIDARQFSWGKLEPGAGISVHCKIEFKNGIEQTKAKALAKQIKDKGLKVQTQIQGEEIRVTSKSKDDLQKTMAFVKELDLDFPVEFVNMR
ncbi:YajQ family cyclic di-GMP-binding protein [bacterium]|nr:MAG: YajQ family cyclic di-GMP-binding protein [bacterium]